MNVDPLQAIVFYVVFVFSATLHEAAHALVAKRGGDLTAYLGGQVTLDPRPHIRREPVGLVWLPLISVAVSGWPIGFASAPYDPHWARRHPRRAAWMALAGPGANLLLVIVCAVGIRAGLAADVFVLPPALGFGDLVDAPGGAPAHVLGVVLSCLFSLNLVLFVLNLIPVPPLDGHAALGLVLPAPTLHRYQDALARSGIAWMGILFAWWVFHQVFAEIFWWAVAVLYPEARYGP